MVLLRELEDLTTSGGDGFLLCASFRWLLVPEKDCKRDNLLAKSEDLDLIISEKDLDFFSEMEEGTDSTAEVCWTYGRCFRRLFLRW